MAWISALPYALAVALLLASWLAYRRAARTRASWPRAALLLYAASLAVRPVGLGFPAVLIVVVVLMAGFADEKPFAGLVRREQIHDLGKLLLAFVMLWAYINLSQFLIVWSGNLPEEIPWYLKRAQGGWQWLGLALVLFHFVLPFLLLLSRDLKRNAGLLGTVAGVILVFRLVDLFWLVAPETAGGHGGHAPGFAVHWLDLGALLAVGGLWLLAFVRELKGRSLLPTGEPELRELLEGAVE